MVGAGRRAHHQHLVDRRRSRAPARFSAYVASKAALDAWSECAASEFIDNNVHFTTINMPLVRTAHDRAHEDLQPRADASSEEAADLVVQAIVYRPVRSRRAWGSSARILHAVAARRRPASS
jgi:NAD(P)-dependent dehydrogenase (short-subunit alcohol dehydrogenase family)